MKCTGAIIKRNWNYVRNHFLKFMSVGQFCSAIANHDLKKIACLGDDENM